MAIPYWLVNAMPPPSLCVIHNPTAGRGFSRGFWRAVRQALGSAAEYRMTTRPEHAAELAEQAAKEGFATIAAAGGDGTVHEVANGLLRAGPHAAAFGVIPLGSGNDYARMLDLPREPRLLAERLLGEDVWPVDVGHLKADGIGERFFVNTVGFGLSACVTWESRQIKRLKGVPLYALAATRAILRRFQAVKTRLVIDDLDSVTATLYLAVALGRAEGAGFIVAPDAELDDGWFDYLHAGEMTRLAAFGWLPRMLLGKLPASGGPIRRGRCKKVMIEAAEPLFCHADGELVSYPGRFATKFEVTLLPGALRVRGRKRSTWEALPLPLFAFGPRRQ